MNDQPKYTVSRFNKETTNWETVHSKERVMVETMWIGPEIANILLEGDKSQRKLSERDAQKYARAMKEGQFKLGDSCICIDNEHNLLNGQHRMWGILYSKTTQLFVVTWGATKEDQEHYDSDVRLRTLHDVCTLAGMQVEPFETSVGRYIRRQTIQHIPRHATRAEEKTFVEQHIDGLRWINRIFRPTDMKKGQRTPRSVTKGNDVASAFVRAYLFYRDDPEKQARVELMARGMIEMDIYSNLLARRNEGDGAFFRLVAYMSDHGAQGQGGRDDRYRKTEKAILQFVRGESKSMLIASKDELFLLPVELEAKILNKTALAKEESEKTTVTDSETALENA